MKKQLAQLLLSGLLALTSGSVMASVGGVHLDSAPVDLNDKDSLRNGAKYYMNYCHGCHALGLSRYNRVANDLGIPVDADAADQQGISPELASVLVDGNISTISDTLIFTRGEDGKPSAIGSLMKNAIPAEDSVKWFGVVPPDLSLSGRLRGADWIYTYLRSFYLDPNKASGVNNLVFKDVSMPHVLWELQGFQSYVDHKELKITQPGSMTAEEYDKVVGDITNFLVYVGEPGKIGSTFTGVMVMIFLFVFFILAYLLKKEYWKDIH